MGARTIAALLVLIVAGSYFWQNRQTGTAPPTSSEPRIEHHTGVQPAQSARQTWGRPETLADHYARHGRDFQARDAEDYAAQATTLLQRARVEGLPAKRTSDGITRVFDPATGAFGSYNRDGTTKTFFKPGNPTYFERQPGTPIDLRKDR